MDINNVNNIELSDIKVANEFLDEVIQNLDYNKAVMGYYSKLAKNRDSNKIYNQVDRLDNCNKFWLLDVYKEQKIKDFKKTSRCDDKFCNNCKLVKQAHRLSRFMPFIEESKKDYDLYHLVLTVPNVKGEDLKPTLEKMYKSFFELNRYFALKKKIRGLDFEKFGYAGAIRSLEITYNTRSYHPHLHCIVALKKDLKLEGRNVNKFSFTNKDRKKVRFFKDLEILIQKIWYLKMNDLKVTKSAIDDLEMGYSCILDMVDESTAYEVFKYATKSNTEKGALMTYKQFETLYDALLGTRQIQGYGIFFGIKDDDSAMDKADEIYNALVEKWQKKEEPQESWETPEELRLDTEYTLVSRNSILKKIKEFNF